MIWWAADGSWARGGSWVAFLIIAAAMVLCMTMMSRMMGHHMRGPRSHQDGRPGRGDPERMLGVRLVNGEIDGDEYERLLGVLRRTGARHDHEEV